MSQTLPSTADILTDVIRPADPSFDALFARMVLDMRLSEAPTDRHRINAGALAREEKASLDKMLLAGQFVDLMQAKARRSLQHATATHE